MQVDSVLPSLISFPKERDQNLTSFASNDNEASEEEEEREEEEEDLADEDVCKREEIKMAEIKRLIIVTDLDMITSCYLFLIALVFSMSSIVVKNGLLSW